MVAIYAGKGDMKATPELGGATLSVAGKATFASGTFLDAFCNFNVHATSADNDYATGAFVTMWATTYRTTLPTSTPGRFTTRSFEAG